MEFRNEREALGAEQAVAMFRELEALADATPNGKVLAVVEREAVECCRRIVRDSFQDALNVQAEGPESPGGATTAGPARATARPQRRLVTAAGDVTLRRLYLTCRRCAEHAHPLDERLGIDDFDSPHA